MQKQPFYIEVRPFSTSEIEAENFKAFLEAVFGYTRPFRFLMIDCKDERVEGRRLVRFFIQFPEKIMVEKASNLLKSSLDVDVVKNAPPTKPFAYCASLELEKNYALPLVNLKEKLEINPIDKLVSTLAGSGGAVEVIAYGDPKAAGGITNYIYGRTHRKASMSKALSDQLMGILAEATIRRYPKDISREQWWKYGRQWKENPQVKEDVRNAEEKLRRNLFTCGVRVYGNSTGEIEMIKSALPFGTNKFRTHRTKEGDVEIPVEIEKPKRTALKSRLLYHLWWIAPLLILVTMWLCGFFDPLRILFSPNLLSTDIISIIIAVSSAFLFSWKLKKYNPIVLSVKELAYIVGLPSAIGRLPVALSALPAARMQFGGRREKTLEVPSKERVEEKKKERGIGRWPSARR